MGDLSQLYQSVILDHSKTPRNHRRMEQADAEAKGYNPLCGDQLTVWLKMDGDQVSDISFEAAGCAISRASASLMTLAVKGKSRTEVAQLFQAFHRLVTTGEDAVPGAVPLGKLTVFSGVSEFPSRVKCASLSWHTLKSALDRAASPDGTAALPQQSG